MKKLILLALVTLVMTGCKEGEISTRKDEWNVVTIDSCEYIECNPYGRTLIHKNDCRFCAERKQKELKKLKELVEQLKEK